MLTSSLFTNMVNWAGGADGADLHVMSNRSPIVYAALKPSILGSSRGNAVDLNHNYY